LRVTIREFSTAFSFSRIFQHLLRELMKHQLLRLALAATVLLCVWPRASVAQAAVAGSVVGWGDNDFSGNTDGNKDVPLAAQSGVTAIAAGYRHTVALKNDGTVVAWGWDCYGQVTGTATTEDPSPAVASPVTLGGQVLRGVTAIAVGPDHTVALIGGVELLPSLKARPTGNELILSWPTNAPGFTLQSTLDLTPPVRWLDFTGVPAVVAAHFTLTNTITGTQFYRLRKM
jgi:hypothetical protein